MSQRVSVTATIEAVTILLVEDDPGHARLIEENLRRANVASEVTVLHDGQQAPDYLFSGASMRVWSRPRLCWCFSI